MADEAEVLCDPCQVKTKGVVCGWQSKSLAPHLKKHKKAGGACWTVAEYRKKFPGFSLGPPSYTPPPEQIKKLQAGFAAKIQEPKKPENVAAAIEDKAEKQARYEETIRLRSEELWSMCERDPAAKMFCIAAATDEALQQEAYDEIAALRLSKEYDKLKGVNQALAAIADRLDKNMKSLSLTVEQRRKSNQLGSDSVAQLICGYANALRKKSPDSREAFLRRVATVQQIIAERVRVNTLSQVDDSFDQAVAVTDESDYRSAILGFSAKAG